MVSRQEMVRAFMEKHGFPVDMWQKLAGSKDVDSAVCNELEWHRNWLKRVGHMQEELSELANAAARKDIVGVADAVADLLYLTYGAALLAGVDIGPVFNEVHSSNMTKDTRTGRFSDGFKPKGPNYRPPDVRGRLEEQGVAPLE